MAKNQNNLFAELFADYLDYLNGVGGRSREQIISSVSDPVLAAKLRAELDQLDEFRKLVGKMQDSHC
jgi:hypothetical protein